MNVQLTQGALSGSLGGVALASDGFSIAGVSIAIHRVAGSIARNLGYGGRRDVARDLPPGPYQVVATKPGFSVATPIIVEVVKNRTANASVFPADVKPMPIAGAVPLWLLLKLGMPSQLRTGQLLRLHLPPGSGYPDTVCFR